MEMPRIGFGTWPLTDEVAERVVTEAIGMGYRHVDTAQMYGNEAKVGAGIRAAGVAREALFVTTKIHQDRFLDGTALDSAKRSVDDLGGPVDLMLCHWPPRGMAVEAVIDGLEEVRAAGLTGAIGISNFNVPQMRVAAGRAPVMTNQVEYHLLLDQARLKAAADELGVVLTAYRPIGKGKVLDLPLVQDIAARLGRSPSAVALRWIIEMGVVPIPMSTKPQNLADNLSALAFSLSPEDVEALTALTQTNLRLCNQPQWEPDWHA